jgi:two-component sensor histidine kinase
VPDDTGFGTRLIQATVSGTGGEIEYQWADEGLCAHLRLPLASLKN